MNSFHSMKNRKYEALGEIDSGLVLYSRGERVDLYDVWPGKHTDIASLERNAAAFRNEERRRFFRKLRQVIVAPFRSLFRHIAARRAQAHASSRHAARPAGNNFAGILAATYCTALYRSQIPKKDERDD